MCYKQKCKVVSLNLAHPVHTTRRWQEIIRTQTMTSLHHHRWIMQSPMTLSDEGHFSCFMLFLTQYGGRCHLCNSWLTSRMLGPYV